MYHVVNNLFKTQMYNLLTVIINERLIIIQRYIDRKARIEKQPFTHRNFSVGEQNKNANF